jgi:hypothetical protein
MVLLFWGFTGSAFTEEQHSSMGPGETMRIGGFRLDFLRLRTEYDFERNAIFADLNVKSDGNAVGVLSPARFIYHSHPGQPTSEVVISSTLARDLFLILGQPDLRSGRATIRVVVNPLVAWIWIGGILLVIGTVIASFDKGWLARLNARILENRHIWIRAAAAMGIVAVLFAATWGIRDLTTAILILLGACLLFMLLFVSNACSRLLAAKGSQ